MATIDKSLCTYCTMEEKCKHTKNCKSNELAINVKKAMIEKMVQWLNDNKVRDDIVGYFLDTQREEMREEFIDEFKKAMEE